MAQKITIENWNTALFHSNDLMAFISIGADPTQNNQEVHIQYHVTLSNKDYEDLYQSAHESLEEAVDTLNAKYGDWQFKSLMQENSDNGCSSCAAH